MKILYTAATVLFLSWFLTGISMAGELTPLYPGYPEVFDANGSLDLKGENKLVINDLTYQVGSSTSYHVPKGSVSLDSFSERDQVGVILLPDSMEIQSLWLINSAEPVVQEKREQEAPSTIKDEGGVWKN